MNSSPASVVGILDRLSIGVCRISIRHGHTAPRIKNPHPELTGFKAGLGEKIWVHNHVVTGMIIYSHDGKLKVRYPAATADQQLVHAHSASSPTGRIAVIIS